MWSEARGHAGPRRMIRRALERGRLGHALLVTGEMGIGKRDLASWLVAAAWCAADDRPCGACASCRKVAAGSHPDLTVLAREEDKQEITVDQIRLGVVAALGRRPLEAAGRAVLLHDADEMNEEAQNALLKSLEEPPAGSLIVLTSSRESSLLDTIASRCQPLRLSPLSDEEMAAIATPGEAALARGRPGMLERLRELEADVLVACLDELLAGTASAGAFSHRLRASLPDDDRAAHGVAIDVLRAHLAARAVAEPGLAAAEADACLLEAGDDLRRNLPLGAVWTALGAGLARVGGASATAPRM